MDGEPITDDWAMPSGDWKIKIILIMIFPYRESIRDTVFVS
jgi:hypothetical protein